MDFGRIIKRSWQITWRYKALWVLGVFAGISGCQPGGGGGGGSSWRTDSFPGGTDYTGTAISRDFVRFADRVEEWLPALIAGVGLLVVLGVVWAILGIAARGGLVTGVNAAEQGGSPARLGELWHAGFARFWSLVGVDILLALPVVIVVVALAAGIGIPLVGFAATGQEPGASMILPVCGALALGVPLLILLGFVLGIMHPLAVRYVMLGGQGSFTAAANAWRFLRARVKDSVLMWLISGALNLGASIVIAIPLVILGLGFGIPLFGSAMAEQWGIVIGLGSALVVALILVSIAYTGVWGTFTSALWTLFFREVAGMGTLGVEPQLQPEPGVAAPYAPPPPPMAPMTGAPSDGDFA